MRRLDGQRLERLEPLAAQALAAIETTGWGEGEGAPALVVDALLEAMFLMAVADGVVQEEEIRQFARSCERLLGDVTEGDVEGMFMAWAGGLAEDGWEARMRSISGTVAGTDLAELAFRLAVALAVVDDRLVREEADGIEIMAQALGIDPERSRRIVREVHAEIVGPR
jgi:tellurite resistance protein